MGRYLLICASIAVFFSLMWTDHWKYVKYPPDTIVVIGTDIIVAVGLLVIGVVLDEVQKKRKTSLEE
ncbi:hypothetical protein A3K79_07455 [Candidatus Bathyarchaeota archaeon RBG_13_46_16b]|nr:MAG: hypothetical protein A3K79_07455 [Candidatus Bathyarchaeota archaeon RBG_13_46_16b]